VRRAWLVGVVLVVILAAWFLPARAENGLIAVDDHFLDLSRVDVGNTTAAVDTAPPGLVYLPRSGDSVALRPGALQYAVVVPGGISGYVWNGTAMARDPQLDVSFPGAVAVAFSEDGGFLAAASSSEVRVYGFDQAGSPRQVAAVGGFSGVVALEPGPARDFWVAQSNRLVYLGFDGNAWRQVQSVPLTRGLSASWSGARQSLAVLDGDRVRYFGFDGSSFVEVPSCGAQVAGASGVVQHGHGYSVISGQSAQGYAITASGAVRSPGLDVALPERGFGGAESPWGEYDWAAVTSWGVRYFAWEGSRWVLDGVRSVPGTFGGYRDFAELRSVAFPASEPVRRVRLEAECQVPGGTSLVFEVSTDGGATWTAVPLAENTDVPEGNSLIYRVLFSTSDPALTPVLDRVRALQIKYLNVPAGVKLLR